MLTFSNTPPAFSTSQKSSVVGDNTNNGVKESSKHQQRRRCLFVMYSDEITSSFLLAMTKWYYGLAVLKS